MIELVVQLAILASIILGAFGLKRWVHGTIQKEKHTLLTYVENEKRGLMQTYQAEKQWMIEKYIAEKNDLIENLPQLADIIFMKIRGTLGGIASGAARLDKGLAEAAVEDFVKGNNPLLGAIMDKVPAIKSFVTKNPGALPQVLGFLGGGIPGKASNTGTRDILEEIRKAYG